jgi:deoxyribonuclease-4
MTDKMIHLGCHVSIRNGYLHAAKTARRLGATAFQYFPKNPRSLSVKPFAQTDAAACARFCREHGLVSIAHSPYPTNLAVGTEEERRKTAASLRNDLEIAEACGSVGVVVHFGSYRGDDLLQGYRNIIQCLNETLKGWNGKAYLLLENQAGDSGGIGATMEELTQIRRLCAVPERIGFCLDTCHAFASGVWNGNNWEQVEQKGKETGFFDAVKAVHLNDSLFPSGSRKDRHAPLGRGRIGLSAIEQLLRSLVDRDIAFVLETPSPEGAYDSEIQLAQRLIAGAMQGKVKRGD